MAATNQATCFEPPERSFESRPEDLIVASIDASHAGTMAITGVGDGD
jgi:hypothetical protein